MSLAWESHGDGEATIVVLPWFGVDRSFAAAAFEPACSESQFRRIYIDLPGCGESLPCDPNSDAIVEEAERFIDGHLADTAVLLAGFSYGGYLAAGLARRRPEKIIGLLLACTGLRIRTEDREVPPPPATPPAWRADLSDEFREHLTAALGTRSPAAAREVDQRLRALPPADDEYLERLRSHGYPLTDERDPFTFDGPAAIVCGRQDRIVGYTTQFRALEHFPAASYTVLDRAGHYLPFERPNEFAAAVREWLTRVSQ